MINALTAAITPVSSAFLIMGLVTSIYSILGVSFFKHAGEDGVGRELFGTFFRAIFTMFQVCTGDGWSDDIARPLFQGEPGDRPDPGTTQEP